MVDAQVTNATRKSPTLLGTVEDVLGASVGVRLNGDIISGITFVDGQGYRVGQLGSFVRIPIGYFELFGIVSQVGAGAVPSNIAHLEPHGHRWLRVQLVGESRQTGLFQRGLSQFPTIGDDVHLLTESDLARIYGRPNEPYFVQVGHVANAESIPALLDVNKLITRHSAVLGATGAGKSTTVAGLLASLSDESRYASARILVVDIHGEYAAALRDRSTVFKIAPNSNSNEVPLRVPYWAMTYEELLSVSFGPLDDTGYGAIADRILSMKRSALSKQSMRGSNPETISVDTPVPFSIHQLWFDLHCEMRATHYEQKGVPQSPTTWALEKDEQGKAIEPGDPLQAIPPRFLPIKDVAGDKEKIRHSTSRLSIGRAVDSLGSRLRDSRFDFLFKPEPWLPQVSTGKVDKDLDTLLGMWLGGDKPIAILDLSGVPSVILTELIATCLRVVYDALFWARNLSEGGRERPLLIVLEEAHAYLNAEGGRHATQAVRRIFREGRKYGIGAMVVSQRPSEIDQTVLSQCGTLFAMRMSNTGDREHVLGAVTENLHGLLDMLPTLRTGECIVMGEGVHLPVRAVIDLPPENRRPDSTDPRVFEDQYPGGWNRDREPSDYGDVVEVWRRQTPRSPRASGAEKGAK